MLSQNLTSHQVHKTIQVMDIALADHSNAIAIHRIAEQLHVPAVELCVHIITLKNLYYIKFADRLNTSIYLTLNGRCTLMP
jgi:hypothetical protein